MVLCWLWMMPDSRGHRPSLSRHWLLGRALAFQTDKSTTVGQLKSMIQGREGVPPDQQRLIYAGYQLADDNPLFSYGVREGSILHLVLRLRGT